jgi:CcmD family protein
VSAINYVGLAYAAVFFLFFLYAFRLSQASRRLERKLEELERENASR